MPRLYVVTATIDPEKTHHLWRSWRENATHDDWEGHVLVNSGQSQGQDDDKVNADLIRLTSPGRYSRALEVVGVVPAFHAVTAALPANDDIIALLHDDVRINEKGWDEKLLWWFENHPGCVLAGFGGAYGVGREGMYDLCRGCHGSGEQVLFDAGSIWQAPPSAPPLSPDGPFVKERRACPDCSGTGGFDPMSLARHHFMSNMEGAEAHGERVHTPRPVAVLDGFSMVGRAWFVKEALRELRDRGVVHHAYDVYFGVKARAMGKQTWLLPFDVHHHGGMSAVANPQYADWANREHGGDQNVWLQAHRAVWEMGRGVMPFDVRKER